MKKSLKITLVSVVAILILVIIGASVFANKILSETNIYSGVKVKNVDVGGLSKNDAQVKLKSELDKGLEDKEITIVGEEYSKILKYKELGVKNDYNKAVEEAYKVGREGNFFVKLKEINNAKRKGENIDIAIKKDSNSVKKIVDSIANELYIKKKEATIRLSNGNFIVTDDVIGKAIDKELLEKNLYEAINKSDSVKLNLTIDKPRATKALLSQVREQIGTYSTKFKLGDSSRVFNIQRASNSINNKVVLPGETFSFNSTTGPRSLGAGYKEATVIMNGEFVPGEGGGVCQVSSTLYNTLLNSKVNIVERHSHSKPISYVPTGRDATVTYNALDLKFKNNYSSPVYIKATVVGDSIIITLYGNKSGK